MSDNDDLYEALRALSRGRGVPGDDLPERLGAWLPGGWAQIEAVLRARIDDLPPDLRLVALGALGLHPEIGARFLSGRISRLGDLLERDERTVRRRIDEALRLLADRAHPAAAISVESRPRGGTVEVRAGDRLSRVSVDVCPIELLTGVDALVASGNIHLEQPQTYKSSGSASLRRAAARRGPAGEIVDDVLTRELAGWNAVHGRPGLPVAPGTVIPLSPGELEGRGVRRVYYAALATARAGTSDYDIAPATVALTVSGVFAAARADRLDPRPRSLGLPLLGAGRGGLSPAASAGWIRTALERELPVGGPWHVHLVTRRAELVPVILTELRDFADR